MRSGSNPHLPIVDCRLSAWSPWSTCSAACGHGRKTRSRYIIRAPQNGGKPCDEKLTKTQKCKDLPPCPDGQANYQNFTRPLVPRDHGEKAIRLESPRHRLRTTTSTTTSVSILDDEDDSKFSRLTQSETASFAP